MKLQLDSTAVAAALNGIAERDRRIAQLEAKCRRLGRMYAACALVISRMNRAHDAAIVSDPGSRNKLWRRVWRYDAAIEKVNSLLRAPAPKTELP